MKKFVTAVIYSLIITLLSVAIIFLLQAPLLSFVYYGFLAENNSITFSTNIINKIVNTDTLTIIIMIVQTVLTLGFIILMFIFIKKILYIFLKKEKLIRPYYYIFFFMTLIIPIILIILSIYLRVKLTIIILVVEGVFTVLNVVLIIFSRKILPDTTDYEYRKYLFTEGSKEDE